MARVKDNLYESISVNEIKSPILFVVDMINGFVKNGPLHDPEINSITPNIQKLLKELSGPRWFVCDSHSQNAREFQSYPPHCIAESEESKVIDELCPYVQDVLYKNSTNTFHAKGFSKIIPLLDNHSDIVITGCCTDLCILQFALSLNAWLNEYDRCNRIILPVDCVDTYHIPDVHDAYDWNRFALANMKMNGIMVVSHIRED